MREDVFNKIFTIQISSKFINIPGEKQKLSPRSSKGMVLLRMVWESQIYI